MRRGLRHVKFDREPLPHRRKFGHGRATRWGLGSVRWLLALFLAIFWLVGAVELAKVVAGLRHFQHDLAVLKSRYNETLAWVDWLEEGHQQQDDRPPQWPDSADVTQPVVLWPRERIAVPLPRQFTDPGIDHSGWHVFDLAAGVPHNSATAQRPISSAIVELTTRAGHSADSPPGASLVVRFGVNGAGAGVVVVRHSPSPTMLPAGASVVRHHRLLVPVDARLRIWVAKEDSLQSDSGVVGLDVVGFV